MARRKIPPIKPVPKSIPRAILEAKTAIDFVELSRSLLLLQTRVEMELQKLAGVQYEGREKHIRLAVNELKKAKMGQRIIAGRLQRLRAEVPVKKPVIDRLKNRRKGK